MATETVSKEQLEQLKKLYTTSKEWLAMIKSNEATLPAAYKAKVEKRLAKINTICKLAAKAYKVQKPNVTEKEDKSFLDKVVDTVVPEDVQEKIREKIDAILRNKLTSLMSKINSLTPKK
ncbi:MAG: hypothetical protein GY810_05580 [Aureispira sp.]|nr:hypothetical protein [Aureispira sp.]